MCQCVQSANVQLSVLAGKYAGWQTDGQKPNNDLIYCTQGRFPPKNDIIYNESYTYNKNITYKVFSFRAVT